MVKELVLPFVLDEWQREVLDAEGNLCICSGRQVGKSQVVAIKAALFCSKYPGKQVLIISVTEDQAERMLQKILLFLHDNDRGAIKRGKDRPTKHRVVFTNGSSIVTKAVGQYGLGVLGMTVDVVIPDEAAFLPEAIWPSITPMLLTTGGNIWMLSTPNAMSGYFYDAYTNKDMGFRTFHVNSEEVARARPEPQRSIMLDYLASEKARMTEMQYAQWYLAQFQEELGRFFPDELIEEACSLEPVVGKSERSSFFLGVDVARLGGDEITFEIIELRGDLLLHRVNRVNSYKRTTETTDMIVDLDFEWNFTNIYVDDGGVGAGVFDQLLEEDGIKRKVVAVNNAARPLDRDRSRSKKLLKEDLYMNLKWLMERKRIRLLKDSAVHSSLKSIMIEYSNKNSNISIYGRYTHIVEGLIRAAWCVRARRLNLFFETA